MVVYHSTKALLEGLVALSASCSSKLELKTLNTTNDGWPLRSASIGSGPTKVLLSFGIHGREYMTSEIAMNLLTKLCSGDEHRLLKDVTFTTMPIFNPDGRARTDAALGLGTSLRDQSCGDRRKNGKYVDLNRNFDWDWDDVTASSGDAQSTSYRGPAPNSELESQTLDALAGAVKPDMYIDIHTGTLAMYAPWNHNSSGGLNNDEAIALLDKVATETSWHRDQKPKFGVGGIVSYLASGTAADFVFAKHHPRYAFIFETYLQGANAGNTESRMGVSSADLTMKLPRGAMAHRVAANRRPPPTAADSLQPQELRALARQHSTFANATVSSSKPSEWMGDSCFEYFSPIDEEGLEGLVRAWTSALLLASRTLVADVARDAAKAGGASRKGGALGARGLALAASDADASTPAGDGNEAGATQTHGGPSCVLTGCEHGSEKVSENWPDGRNACPCPCPCEVDENTNQNIDDRVSPSPPPAILPALDLVSEVLK